MQSMSSRENDLVKECRSEVEFLLEKKDIRENREYKEFIAERQSIIEAYIQQDKYLFDDYFHRRCRSILDQMVGVDTNLQSIIKDVLVGRSFVPNAYCFGNGILVINLGLISRFENDDQMAFVIAHELSHQILNHVDTKIKKQIAYYKSKEYKKSIRKLKRSDYNQFSKYESFILSQQLNSRAYTRQRERQADSLAVILMRKAGYNPTAALEALEILDRSDQPIHNGTINFAAHFSNGNFQFNNGWLRKLNGLKVEQKISQELIDSLKTHPDCDVRAKRLARLFELDNLKGTTYDSIYSDMQYRALMENIQYSLQIKRYALALTESLQLLNHFPENRYLQSTVGICLAEIYLAQKEHRLREFVPRPDDDYQYNYHQTLLLVENIRYSDLRDLTLAYMEKQSQQWNGTTIESEQHLIYHQYLYNKIKGDIARDKYKSIYLENFPDGYFTYSFN